MWALTNAAGSGRLHDALVGNGRFMGGPPHSGFRALETAEHHLVGADEQRAQIANVFTPAGQGDSRRPGPSVQGSQITLVHPRPEALSQKLSPAAIVHGGRGYESRLAFDRGKTLYVVRADPF
jgi:hypothetical protein